MKKIMVFALCASCGAVFAADAVVDTVTGEPQVVSKATSTSYVFTSGGSITFSQSGTIDLLMVGGGGAGGTMIGAGGGAGEMKAISSYEVEAGVEYAVTIGAGGAPSGVQGMANWFQIGGNGGDTTFGELTAIGGGAGGNYYWGDGADGGSGGGASGGKSTGGYAPNASVALGVAVSQNDGAHYNADLGYHYLGGGCADGNGNRGGDSYNLLGGGGGGAGSAGGLPAHDLSVAGAGGAGKLNWFAGALAYYAAGGGAGGNSDGGNSAGAPGGSGIGGRGGNAWEEGAAGADGTGSGGGGGGWNGGTAFAGGRGGSGVVVVRVRVGGDGGLGEAVDFGDDVAYSYDGDRHLFTYCSDGIYVPSEAVRVYRSVAGGEFLDIGYYAAGELLAIEASSQSPCTIAIELGAAVEMGTARVGAITGLCETNEYSVYTSYTFSDPSTPSVVVFAQSGYVDLLMVGGGGSGGAMIGGGGGAGEFKLVSRYAVRPNVPYAVAVGAGGMPGPANSWHVCGSNGGDTAFGSLVAIGGGAGAGYYAAGGRSGGSGGGAAGGRLNNGYLDNGGAAVNDGASQDEHGNFYYPGGGCVAGGGNPGGDTYYFIAAGGGGAGSAGGSPEADLLRAGAGGDGVQSDFTGAMRWYAAGGGAGANNDGSNTAPAPGGSGIGGAGAPIGGSAGDGADGTGSGGGGGSWGAGAMPGGRGGSGILVLRIGELDGESADPAGYDGRLAETIAGGGVFAGTIQSLGAGASLADVFLEYGLSADNLKFTNYVATVGAEGDFSGTVRGLSTRTVYYGRLFATNDVAGAAACRLSDVFRFETADDAYLDNYNGNDGFWQGVSNGTYNASFAIDDGAGRAFADEMYAVHLNSGWNPNTWNVYGFDAGNEHTCGWSEMVTFGYETMMFMEGGKTYAFAANIDDHAIVVVDGTKIVDTDATGYGAPASSLPKGYFAPQADGWYRVDVYAGNAYQGAGCWDGFIGVGWSDDGGESWNRFLNPAGGPVRFFAPVDDAAEIIRVSREGDSVSAFVQFSKFAAGSGLAAYWASTYPGTATNGWTRVEGIDGTLGASCAGYFSFDIPSGAEYLRFAALKGDYVFQSKALRTCEIDAPDGTGIAAGFVSFGDGGLDSMPVNIVVYSCGEAETADIVVSYGTSPGDLDQSATFGGRGAGIAEIEIGGLVHGTEYFMSFRLENERGERSAQSGTYRYSTLSGASFVPGSMSASDGGTTRFGVSLSGLRDGQTTTVYLYTGDVGSTLTNTCQAVVSPDADGFSADVVFPFLTGSFDYRFVVSNAYHGVVWGESTETATKQIYDSTVYYWRGPDGDWRDPANWTAEGGDGRATYPDSREAVAVIIPDSVSVPVEIALDGTIQAKQIRFMQTGTKAVFSGNGKDSTVLDVAGDDCWNATTENVSMAFRDLCLHSAGFYMWNGCTVSVERAKARLSSETRMIGNNSALIVVGGSELRQTREFIGTLGDNVNIVLDDSAILQDAGGLNLCYENWAGSCRIDICGENPLVRTWGYAVLSGLNSAPAGVVPEIVFHLPAGGYSEPPFMVVSEGYRFLDLSKQRLKISIAEDSPALHMSGKVNTMLLDAKWGIRSDLVDLDNSVEQAVLGYDDPENPTAILVSASCPGFVIIVK